MLRTDLIRIIDDVFHYKLFEVKRTPVTLSSIMVFILILLLFAVLSRALQRTVFRRILNRIFRTFQRSHRGIFGHVS